jgi:hypothetical protein
MTPPTGKGARPPVVRAAPATLEDHMSRAYAARFQLDGADSEQFSDVVQRLAQAGIPKPRLQAERDRLAAVEARCVVSLTQRQTIDAALEQMPPG